MKKINYISIITALLVSQAMFTQYTADDWDERDTWMDFNYIFDEAGIELGSNVADIGCHEGYLTVRLATRVTDIGTVYAVDVDENRLEGLRENLESENLKNVEVILGDYDNPKLPENELDVVIIMDTYHEIDDYMKVLDYVYSALKSGGRIVMVEKLKSRIKGKSRDAQTDAHSLGIKYVKKELRKSGFKVFYQNDDLGDWENDRDKVIWMLIAKKEE